MPELMVHKYFNGKLRSVGLAREFTVTTLTARGLDGLTDDVRLCVSELATNALAHGTEPGRGFLIKLTGDNDTVRLEVHDSRSLRSDSQRPFVRHPEPADTSGRGLLLVEMLADAWGVESRQPFGKIVWARCKAAVIRDAGCSSTPSTTQPQPFEADDTTRLDAARRELSEETGIPADTVAPVGDSPLHIDIHPIGANDAKGEPDHQHVDFRFLFTTSAEVGALQTEEVTDAAWRPVDTLHDERLKQRVTRALR